jgi:hypothetical protein
METPRTEMDITVFDPLFPTEKVIVSKIPPDPLVDRKLREDAAPSPPTKRRLDVTPVPPTTLGAVITLAAKLPEASRATMAFAVFTEVAVVAEFATFPAVVIVASFESVIVPAVISPSTISEEERRPPTACTTPVVTKLGIVTADTPLPIVTEVELVPPRVSAPTKSKDVEISDVAVIAPAEKFPEPSLATMADTVLADVAVVALLDTLPAVAMVASLLSTIPAAAMISALVTADVVRRPEPLVWTTPVAFRLGMVTESMPTFPKTSDVALTPPIVNAPGLAVSTLLVANDAVIVPAEKLPEASRATIVDGVFADVAVVAELATLPAVAMVASLLSTIPAAAIISLLVTREVVRRPLAELCTTPVVAKPVIVTPVEAMLIT